MASSEEVETTITSIAHNPSVDSVAFIGTTPTPAPRSLSPPARPALARTISSQSAASTASAASFSSRSRKDKPRLYLALYPRTTSNFRNLTNCDDVYHWSFLIAPKTSARSDPGTRYHIYHDQNTSFFYDEDDFQSSDGQKILVRIALAKVVDPTRLAKILREVAIPPRTSIPSSFTCLKWVRSAFTALIKDGKCLKGYVTTDDWTEIEETARKYGKQKREQRRFTDRLGPWNAASVPTWNFWERRQTTA